MGRRIFCLFHSLEEYVCPSTLTAGSLYFVLFLGSTYRPACLPTYLPTYLPANYLITRPPPTHAPIYL
jgi:hypothetical protein